MSQKTIWDNFTGKFQLQKTLRFELKPVGRTEEHIRSKNIIQSQWVNGKNRTSGKDAKLAENYRILKQALNEMHRQFLNEALDYEHLSKFLAESDMANLHKAWQKARVSDKGAKEFAKLKAKVASKIKKALDEKANEWKKEATVDFKKHKGNAGKKMKKIEKSGIAALCQSTSAPFAFLNWLLQNGRLNEIKKSENAQYSKEELQGVLQSFQDFHSYISGFNENRANVYDMTNDNHNTETANDTTFKSTSVAHRILDENLEFFFQNNLYWQTFEKNIKKTENKKVLKEKNWDISKKEKALENALRKHKLRVSTKSLKNPTSYLHFCTQEGIDAYNHVLGGFPAEAGKEKIQGVNEIINLTRQQLGGDRRDFPTLSLFYKQILSKRDKNFIDAFEEDSDLIQALRQFHKQSTEKKERKNLNPQAKKTPKRDVYENIKFLFSDIFQETQQKNTTHNTNQMDGYFLSVKAANRISKDICGNYSTILSWFRDSLDDSKETKKYNEKLKTKKYFSFSEIENFVSEILAHDKTAVKKRWHNFSMESYIQEKLKLLIDGSLPHEDEKGKQDAQSIEAISIKSALSDSNLQNIFKAKGKDSISAEEKKAIKNYLDANLELFHFVKSFLVNKGDLLPKQQEQEAQSSAFVSAIQEILEKEFFLPALYNKTRNYLTKKPYSTDKIKLNFENPTLGAGWDVNKETDNTCVLLFKDGLYYLGVMDKNHSHIFKNINDKKREISIRKIEEELSAQKNKIANKKKSSKGHQDLQEKILNLEARLEHLKSLSVTQKDEFFQKVRYKFLKDATTMIPKCSTQLKIVQSHFTRNNSDFVINAKIQQKMLKPLVIKKEIYDLNNMVYDEETKTFRKKKKDDKAPKKFQKKYLKLTGDGAGYKNALKKWIKFCKKFLDSYESALEFDFSNLRRAEEYDSLDQAYKDINQIIYSIQFEKIKKSYIDQLVEEGKLYLFQIYNKDFSPYAKGRENLHTSYWKLLFDERNLKDVVLKLNGQAELFFRPASIKKGNPTHPKDKAIKNKNPNAVKKKSQFAYDIIKDRRFTQNKYMFHVPITLNFKAPDNSYLNREVEAVLANNPKAHIIGIDRGEKHLLYYSVVNQKGEIVEQGSLNTIQSSYKPKNTNSDKTEIVETPYQTLLAKREIERDKARKSWENIESIKELKAGYLSQVVHKLAQLIIQYDAIVVLEDLNQGFKRGRFKVEKQVYQKFERALIEKLNYLVLKDQVPGKSGHYLKAFQLTNKFESFQRLGKQCGILFYTAASYTSKTDPVTGYMQNLYHKQFHKEKTREFFEKFEAIRFNGNYFEFCYDLVKFSDNEDLPKQSRWTVCSKPERSEYNSQTKKRRIFSPTERLLGLFEKAGISKTELKNMGNLKGIVTKQEDSFLRGFLKTFNAILNMRVIGEGEQGTAENDKILSPVEPFYDSSKIAEFATKKNKLYQAPLPFDGDGNGAYNIARKGIIILEKITLRQQTLKALGKEGPYFKWSVLQKEITKMKDKKKLEDTLQKWAKLNGESYDSLESFFADKKQTRLSAKGERFLKFVQSLSVTKQDWQNYAQRSDIVIKQKQVYGKLYSDLGTE